MQEIIKESEIETVTKAIERVKNLPELKEAHPKEQVKEVMRQMSEVQANATTAPTTSTATAKDDTNYLPQYMDKESPEVKREVEGLLQLTVDKGLLEGIKAA